MQRRILQAVTAAAVIGLTASLATSAGAAAPTADDSVAAVGAVSAAAVDTVSADASSTLAAGTVLDASGAPVASATVTAFAFPSQAVLAGMKNPGDSFQLATIGQTASDKNGHFSLKPDYSKLGSQQHAKATDPVNVQIIVDALNGWSSYGSTIRFDAAGKATIDVPKDLNATALSAKTASATASKTVASAASGGAMSLNVALTPGTLGHDATVTALAGTAQGVGVVPLSGSPGSSCSVVTNYGPRWAAVGEMSSTVSGYTGQFQYISTAESSVGYGISATGAYGTYSNGGSTSMKSTITLTYPTYSTATSNLMYTEWIYQQFRCVQPTNGVVFYDVFPTDFVSGAKTGSNATATGTYCAPFQAGTGFTKDTTNAVTWTNGVDTQGIIGIALSIKTGFSTTAKLTYNWTTNRSLCGWQDYPPGNAYRLVVK